MTLPLRVVQIVPSISLVYGGPSQMVLGFSKALAAEGIEVTVLTTSANGDRPNQPPLEVPYDRPVLQDGYQIRYFRCAPFRRYKFSLGLLRWLASHTSHFDLAHIHALFSPVSTAAAAIARSAHLPYILRPLGTLDPADLRKKRRLKILYGNLLERPNLAGAAAVHFTSLHEAEQANRFGASTRDWILPLGVDRDAVSLHRETPMADDPARQAEVQALRDRLGLGATQPLLLFLSRLDPKKGLDLLLAALKRLQSEQIPFHCIIAGSNPQEAQYEAWLHHQVNTSPLQHCTTLTGFVSGDAKATLLAAADVFVLPSYYENFGMAVAEALAAGVAVVVSDRVPLWTDICQAGAGWVTPCEVDALTNALRTALSNPTERQRRRANAHRLAQTHYRWEAIAQQTLHLYQQLLPGP